MDLNYFKMLAKKYNLNVCVNKSEVSLYLTYNQRQYTICYFLTSNPNWAHICVGFMISWNDEQKFTIKDTDKVYARNKKQIEYSIKMATKAFNTLTKTVDIMSKEIKMDDKIKDLEKDFKND